MIRFRGVWSGFGKFWGVKGGEMGVCLIPYRELFAPPEVLYATRFGSKHHMMVQLAHGNRVGTTGPFPDLQSPPRGSQRALICANKALFEPWKVAKCQIYGQNAIYMVHIALYFW